jgi:hypothetical protein
LLQPLKVKCLADTGNRYCVLPHHFATQLQLQPRETREATTADGSSHTVPYAEPVRVTFDGCICFVGTLIMSDEVLKDAVPMEDMDLVVHPKPFKIDCKSR